MRPTNLLFVGLLLAGAIPLIAGEADPEILFSDDTDQNIVVRRFSKDLAPNVNDCNTQPTCSNLYVVEYIGTEVPAMGVTVPNVTNAQSSPSILAIQLSSPILLTQAGTVLPLSSFRVVLRQLRLADEPRPTRLEIPLASTFFINENKRTRGLVYRGLRIRARPVGPVVVTLKDPDTGVSFVYEDPEIESYPQPHQPSSLLWQIVLNPVPPRGKALLATVAGIDDFQGSLITRSEKVTFLAAPKGRDDAMFYLKGQKVYNQKGDDQGSVDFKLGTNFFSPAAGQEWWYLVSATVGSKKLKISQTGTLSLGYRKWLGVNPNDLTQVPQWAISVAPTFRTDRDFKNRDLGMDLALVGEPALLYQPLERRRKNAADPQAAMKIAAGWWVKPTLAIEAGKHLASSSDAVDGETFARGLGGLNLMWETDRLSLFNQPTGLKLTVDVAARYLSKDEVTINQNDLLNVEDGYKPYIRAELAYDLGFVGLSVVHENGKLPPAFKTARATTVGLTFKF